ncbi:acetamidase/Formamidase family protein [Rhodovulum sulfidophilum]|uniref:Acetamidase/Formamidase family protein n=1 Tax=Rhodovulum sulfidophilum TaxID=35806 RepID=A0A0D6B0V1_RHOSU|nr:acetamidase/Formamidase family protein [Rhodovulum sulfidophilum]
MLWEGKAASYAAAGKGKKAFRSCPFAGMIRIRFEGSLRCAGPWPCLQTLSPLPGHP